MLIPPTGMALPIVTSLADCADFSKTVAPYLWQFYTSLSRINTEITSIEALKHFYLTTNPVVTALIFVVSTWPIFLIVSEVNRNYSQVDRVWSILPTVFIAHFAIWARLNGMPTQRVDNVLAFSVVWSLRLTFNYWRRGGYQVGSEDYRWLIIQKRIGQPAFFLLNVVFISTLQVLVLFAVTTPTYVILLTSRLHPQLTYYDAAFSRALIGLNVVVYFADQQQWNYHAAKRSYQATAKVPKGYTRAQMDRGFNTTGLWAWSRHPNYAAEQTIWVLLYVWGCVESGTYLNWTVAGCVCYSGIFQGSTPLTEKVSADKYPEYKVYQQKVGRFLPSFLSGGWSEQETEKADGEQKAQDGASKAKK